MSGDESVEPKLFATAGQYKEEDGSHSNPGLGMWMTIATIKLKFPHVQNITTDTLAKQLQLRQPQEKHLALMDCRTPAEYKVSHIEGAQCVNWKHGDPRELLSDLPSDKPCAVVCYCSVGYRSSALAQKLREYLATTESTTNAVRISIYNLEGSIFKWANEGRPMVDSLGQITRMCHPFSLVWRFLLNRQLRSWGSSET